MVHLPFSATVATVLVGAMIAGGAVGVMTMPSTVAPSVQVSADPAAAPSAEPASEAAAATQPRAPRVEQIVVETAPPPNPPLQPENVVRQSKTTTVVAAPVIVTTLGIASGCVGCIERRNDDKAHRPTAKTEHPTPQHATERRDIPPHVRFVRPPQVASVATHR